MSADDSAPLDFSKLNVIDKNGAKADISNFTGDKKVIGIYFSAHWCPPCRGFTPQLIAWYNRVTATDKFNGKLQIIFASSDRDQASFDDYYKDMPWLALDFGDKDSKQALSDKYGIRGIPTLVFLKGDGVLITKDGRSTVSSNKEIEDLGGHV